MKFHKPNPESLKLAAAKNYLAANGIAPVSVYAPPKMLHERIATVIERERENLSWPQI